MIHPDLPEAPAVDRNGVLARLPAADLRLFKARLQPMELRLGSVLYEPGDPVAHLYFPTEGFVSLLAVEESGAVTELALIGSEGMVGALPVFGGDRAAFRALVQAGGRAFRLPADDALARFEHGGAFRAIALLYMRALVLEIAQTAVCNLHHSVDQRLCRWLLMCLDRQRGQDIGMTQEIIADMLGVRRQGVTEAAKKLESRRIISYRRGRITVLDREALARSACDCYRLVQAQTERLFPRKAPGP